MKNLKNKIAILICGIAFFTITNTTTKAFDIAPFCPTYKLNTSCGKSYSYVSCSLRQAVLTAIAMDEAFCADLSF